MNSKEIGEIRRRLRPGKNNIPRVLGCYVNEKREVVSRFSFSPLTTPESEVEKYLSLFKRIFSGKAGKNLLDICFTTQQVADSDEHRLLMALRNSTLQDEGALDAFYERTIATVQAEGSFVILLACDIYDVPYRSRNDDDIPDASDEVFSYVLCAVCPVKATKPSLSYDYNECVFHDHAGEHVLSAPFMGFMFPCFDDRAANIYNALYFTHDTKETQSEFISTIFRTQPPMAPLRQKDTFDSILTTSLGDACSMELVQSLHENITRITQAAQEDKEAPAPTVTGEDMTRMLHSFGIEGDRLDTFRQKFDEEFGEGAAVTPTNLMDDKQFEVRTPSVVIKVDPARSDLIETRIINGAPYILIAVDEGVEVNGVNIRINDN